MKARYDSYCGLYCGSCEFLIATERDKLEEITREIEEYELEELARALEDQQEREFGDPEEHRCLGCKSDVVEKFCEECDIKECAEEKGYEFCFECQEYPCEYLNEFYEGNFAYRKPLFENLERIQEIGLEKWLEEQEQRWSCPSCGKRHCWYDEECRECGAKTKSVKQDRQN